MEVNISSETLKQAAQEGVDEFVLAVKDAIVDAAGGELNAAALGNLNAEQVTLWGYFILREEVMDGGFIQLIYNGYGSFFFRNPFARAVEGWGMDELASIIRKAHRVYDKNRAELEKERSDEDFMALFEQFPQFDEFDHSFVENEEEWTAMIAHYVDEHLDNFVHVVE